MSSITPSKMAVDAAEPKLNQWDRFRWSMFAGTWWEWSHHSPRPNMSDPIVITLTTLLFKQSLSSADILASRTTMHPTRWKLMYTKQKQKQRRKYNWSIWGCNSTNTWKTTTYIIHGSQSKTNRCGRLGGSNSSWWRRLISTAPFNRTRTLKGLLEAGLAFPFLVELSYTHA